MTFEKFIATLRGGVCTSREAAKLGWDAGQSSGFALGRDMALDRVRLTVEAGQPVVLGDIREAVKLPKEGET